MTATTDAKSSAKIPLFSNAAAGGLTGLVAVSVTAWNGHIPFFETDISALKAVVFFILPSLGMYISHAIKSIGFKWSLGSVNRNLLRLNKTKQKELKKDIKNLDGFVSDSKILDLKAQLEQAVQDRHDIISHNYERLISQRDLMQVRYNAHSETLPTDNEELKEILNTQQIK
ncbi:hypothetical protein ACRS9C_22985 [Serratia marcescens]|uniref:hypothetical protein n=1 Tax=Serratia marcescens TaxID=615 RepID=UPI003EE24130